MAKELAEFAATLKGELHFTPKPFYNAEGDCVLFYFKNDESYRERLDDKLTLYRSLNNKEIVGCQIKGIKEMMRKFGNSLIFQHKQLPFAMLIVMSHYEGVASQYEPKRRRKVYDALLNKTADSTLQLPDQWDELENRDEREAMLA